MKKLDELDDLSKDFESGKSNSDYWRVKHARFERDMRDLRSFLRGKHSLKAFSNREIDEWIDCYAKITPTFAMAFYNRHIAPARYRAECERAKRKLDKYIKSFL